MFYVTLKKEEDFLRVPCNGGGARKRCCGRQHREGEDVEHASKKFYMSLSPSLPPSVLVCYKGVMRARRER